MKNCEYNYQYYLDKAVRIAAVLYPEYSFGDEMKLLAEFLGDPWPGNEGNGRMYVDTNKKWIRDLLDKLDGPHCATLLKVMEIRNAEKGKTKSTCSD